MASQDHIVDPSASVLGSRDHWDHAYQRELSNFEENEGDIGEIWFGEDVQERVCDWIGLGCQDDDGEDDKDASKGSEAFPGIRHGSSSILDIGCGNAASLVYLAKEYEFQNLTGVDYSEPAIELARKIVAKTEETAHIKLEVLDLMDLSSLHSRHVTGNAWAFDLLYDKGTFDAICLNEDKSMRAKYVAAIVSMMTSKKSYFVITSCNWTEQELIQMFENMSQHSARAEQHVGLAGVLDHANYSLKWKKTLKHPQFSFGGSTGSAVATCAFTLC